MTGKNLRRLTKYYGRSIGVPELKPHDLRHGVAMEMYGEHGDLEKVRALLGHQRIDTTQIYASIRPTQLKLGGVLRREGESDVERGDENCAACLRRVPRCRSERP